MLWEALLFGSLVGQGGNPHDQRIPIESMKQHAKFYAQLTPQEQGVYEQRAAAHAYDGFGSWKFQACFCKASSSNRLKVCVCVHLVVCVCVCVRLVVRGWDSFVSSWLPCP